MSLQVYQLIYIKTKKDDGIKKAGFTRSWDRTLKAYGHISPPRSPGGQNRKLSIIRDRNKAQPFIFNAIKY